MYFNVNTEDAMKKKDFLSDIEPCCELCEYASRMEITGDLLCKYKNSLKKKDYSDVCKNFSFNIFAYKPGSVKLPKVFDFTKI